MSVLAVRTRQLQCFGLQKEEACRMNAGRMLPFVLSYLVKRTFHIIYHTKNYFMDNIIGYII